MCLLQVSSRATFKLRFYSYPFIIVIVFIPLLVNNELSRLYSYPTYVIVFILLLVNTVPYRNAKTSAEIISETSASKQSHSSSVKLEFKYPHIFRLCDLDVFHNCG